MTNENERLTAMFKENKISAEDYELLAAALDKKTPLRDKTLSILMNPFQKIAGLPALILGLIVIVLMSYLGTRAKVYFPGILDITNSALWPKIHFSFLVLLYQNLVSWLVVAIIFLAAAKILRQKRIRIIDFFGTVALARAPFLLMTGVFSIIRVFAPNPGSLIANATGQASVHVIAESVFAVIAIFFTLWQVVTYFYALQESSGLTGKKLWISFIVAMLFAEAIAAMLTMIFV